MNGGDSWIVSSSGTDNWLFSVYSSDSNTGYVTGAGNTFLKTNNDGVTNIVNALSTKSNFSIYPNPATQKITIEFNQEMAQKFWISIYNIKGELVYSQILQNQNSVDIDVSDLIHGLYMVKIQTKIGYQTERLVIR